MLFDQTLMLADKQAVTDDAAGTDASGNALVITPKGDDYSTMWVAALVDTAFTTSGTPSAATITVQLQTTTASDTSFSSPETLETRTINIATAKKGDVVAFKLPIGLKDKVRVFFDVTLSGGTTPSITAGKLTVGLTDGIWAK